MRWLWIILGICGLSGFTRIHLNYNDQNKIAEEFRNVENSVQDKSFRVVRTTPTLIDLKDGEVVIFSSGAVFIMFRQNQEVYSVNVSCVTVYR